MDVNQDYKTPCVSTFRIGKRPNPATDTDLQRKRRILIAQEEKAVVQGLRAASRTVCRYTYAHTLGCPT